MSTDSLFHKSTKTSKKPSVLLYTSSTQYLQDYYLFRKSIDNSFSYELWAIELNYKSKSSIRQCCYGSKPISENFINSFSKLNQLTNVEKNYFTLIVNYSNEQNPVLKKTYFNQILELTDLTQNRTDLVDCKEFLESPHLPLMQMLMSFADFIATTENLSYLLNLPTETVEKSFKTLEHLGFVKKNLNESSWSSQIKHFKILQNKNTESLKKFHMHTAKEAYEQASCLDITKHFRSLYFSLSDSEYENLVSDLESFILKMKNKYGNDYIKNKRLYKINLQTYPVAKKV